MNKVTVGTRDWLEQGLIQHKLSDALLYAATLISQLSELRESHLCVVLDHQESKS
ncbi:hypothetical protein METHB2_440017 [Candidatus Methylobacter favarea]|uniref:Uncharacterized protein n=1 Tax=Candidatus Methylobacter favarea TaxID=2707345 RepID=A0A8S0XH64_9GAMM|nr:hypothetical protein METHB2_440017 [Candidatus Methylobacter favarea]